MEFNPLDNTQLCVVGNGLFRLFRYSEESLKSIGFQKLDVHSYLCQAWISDDRMVVGTDNGQLLLLESGEIKTEFNLTISDTAEERFKNQFFWNCWHSEPNSLVYFNIYV